MHVERTLRRFLNLDKNILRHSSDGRLGSRCAGRFSFDELEDDVSGVSLIAIPGLDIPPCCVGEADIPC
jgi:hypothetical protein